MTDKIGYVWHLRPLMADRGMFATTELVPHLAKRGVELSREQVYRLVTRTPERLNLAVLVALCDIPMRLKGMPRKAKCAIRKHLTVNGHTSRLGGGPPL